MGAVAAAVIAWTAVAAAPARPDPITFEDIARQGGVDFVLRNSATPLRHQIETMVGGVALFDYDNDGRPDLYFANGAPQPALEKSDPSYHNRFYRNEGGGHFADVTIAAGVRGEGYAMGVAAGDFDNDGFTDLFVAGVDRNLLYRNRGNGTFEDITAPAGLMHRGAGHKPWSIGAGWFDYDHDGRLDLFVVNYCVWIPEREPPCTVGKTRTYCHPKYYAGLPNSLYHNNGDGTFTDVSVSSGVASHIGKGMALSFLDFDADGRLDVMVTKPRWYRRLGPGDGRLRSSAVEPGHHRHRLPEFQ